MVLHALGMCPVCTYRTGRKSRNIPSSLYRLHDTVQAYAAVSVRLRGMARPQPQPFASASVSSTNTASSPPAAVPSLPPPYHSPRSSPPLASNDSSGTSPPASLSSSSEATDPNILRWQTDKETARTRLHASLLTFSTDLADSNKFDFREVSPALFSVLLELTQTLEMEGLLVLEWVDPKQEDKDETIGELCEDVPEEEFKMQMAQRIEAIKMAMVAPKGWYLEEMVLRFEGQGREVVRRMLDAAVRGVGEGERVVLGKEGRELWLGVSGEGQRVVEGDSSSDEDSSDGDA